LESVVSIELSLDWFMFSFNTTFVIDMLLEDLKSGFVATIMQLHLVYVNHLLRLCSR